jgi:hypothetical protein
MIDKPFTEYVAEEASLLIDHLLATKPEIESVAVITGLRIPQAGLPAGIVKGRNGELSSPSEIIHMQQQLLRVMTHMHNQAVTALHKADGLMAERAKQLRELETKIAALNPDR